MTTIRPTGPTLPQLKTKKTGGSRSAEQLESIYESLGGADNPHHGDTMELQKAVTAANLHKGIETYLRQHNKRVPHFIRNIRC